MRDDCDHFRAIESLRLDGELSRVELALHCAHAAVCNDCRRYAAEVAGLTEYIRATLLQAP